MGEISGIEIDGVGSVAVFVDDITDIGGKECSWDTC